MSAVSAVPLRPLAKGTVLKLWLALLALCVAAAALAWIGTGRLQIVTTASGVRFQTIVEGEGPTVTPADLVAMRYVLTKLDGTEIENSDQTGQPFVASTDRVFPGFGEAMQMMQAGGRYRIWIPPGQHVQGPMPPGAPFSAEDTLVFDIRVLQIAPGMAAMQNMMGPPGAPPPGALPPGAEGLPPGALPPGAEGLPPAPPPGAETPPPPGGPPPAGNRQ